MLRMNLPNILTVSRVVLSVAFVVVLSVEMAHGYVWAFGLFLIASITDFLDGWLARRYNLITDFGKLMDPLADKILVTAALVLLAVAGLLPAWFVILILFREFLVTGLRMLALARNQVIAADFWGKLKTVSQMVLICLLLGVEGMDELGWKAAAGWPLWNFGIVVSYWLTLVSTVLSALLYAKSFLHANPQPGTRG